MSDVQKDTELSPAYSSSFSKNHSIVRNEEPKNNRQPSRPPPRPPPSQPFYPGTRRVIQKQPNSIIQSQEPYSKPTFREHPAESSVNHSDTELLYHQKEKRVKKKTENKMRKSTLNKSTYKPKERLMKNPEESKRNCCCICWVNLCYELCTQG
ncbi:uncharacterized protein LOC118193365 [Stegodyphus dumicola]|uniref:uncharacterized protein LOC118193365 n=1 Tax=Stegodyphus dumicola TaxID=202533 RepID=UPI0015ACF7EB|nr:uncharacterized protein LOC118193365 [Stegodyphus dumicola]XP_035220337.1 uncharacterized protein LOC118193365 [Stegodyphus dumicola]